jgi:hypothetical protein
MSFRESLTHFANHPVTALSNASILIATGASEAWGEIGRGLADVEVGAHYGLLFFGVFSLLKVVPEIMDQFERMGEKNPTDARSFSAHPYRRLLHLPSWRPNGRVWSGQAVVLQLILL